MLTEGKKRKKFSLKKKPKGKKYFSMEWQSTSTRIFSSLPIERQIFMSKYQKGSGMRGFEPKKKLSMRLLGAAMKK